MSMLGTLGKIAMGIMVAKGVGSAMGGGSSSGGGLGGLLGSLAGGAGGSKGGIGDLLGSLTGGSQSGNQQGGGLGSLIGSLTGGSQSGNQQGGGLGSLLNSLSGSSQSTQAPSSNNSGDLGGLLSSAFAGNEVKATPDEEKQAEIILKAMISAAKADGHIDANEQKKITEHIGDITPEEIEFVRKEMQSPLDIQGLIDSIPAGMEQQAYMMSLLAIDLDSQSEAEYMVKLGQGLKITPEVANNIHNQLGVPVLYS